MGYSGESLLDLLGGGNTREPTRRAMRDIAREAGDAMTRRAAANTPERTGRTAGAWRSIPATPTASGYESGTENPRPEAVWLEYGTEAHDLAPRRADARSSPEGPRAGARSPGTPALYPLARAAEEVEAEIPAIAAGPLTEWAARIERGAQR